MNPKNLLFVLLSVTLLVACRAPQISYYQDAEDGMSVALKDNGVIKLRSMDEVVVIVNAKDQEYVNVLNFRYITIAM